MTRKSVPPRPERGLAARPVLSRPDGAKAAAGGELRTLAIDVGGTGIKMIVLDAAGDPVNDRARELTPKQATPKNVLAVIKRMIGAQPEYDRVSVGFPGVVIGGVVQTAPNLSNAAWRAYPFQRDLEKLTGVPVRVINDADLQGYGVIEGKNVELVLTLGTGLGSALFVNGHLVPNLELGHHPFEKGKTYEERVSDKVLKRIGKKEWNKRVKAALAQLQPIFNYATLHIGGGNAEYLKFKLPANARLFTNDDGMTAEAVADITTTGSTLRDNRLRVLEDGVILRSQATLFLSRTAPWSAPARANLADLAARLGLAVPQDHQAGGLPGPVTRRRESGPG
jgi:polyphosphate glucokinase